MKKKLLGVLFALFCCLLLSAYAPKPVTAVLTVGGEVKLEHSFAPSLSTRLRLKVKYRSDAVAYAAERGTQELLGDFEEKAALLYAALGRPAIEPEARFDSGVFTYRAGVKGWEAEPAETLSAVLESYPVALAEVRFHPVLPAETIETLQARTVQIGTFSTDYSFSGAGRKHNVERAAVLLNNAVVDSGETISFNTIVGSRTEENGFQNAPIIENGKFVEGVGGGVCQVSTTLYNAALLAGLQPVKVSRHTLPVSYVEPSFDAMVSGATDLVMKNVTDHPVWVWARTDGKRITVTLYGTTPYAGLTLKRVSVTTEVLEASYEEVPTEGIGEPEIVQRAKNGLKSEGYLELYRGRTFLKRIFLRKDTYQKQDGVRAVPIPAEG